MPLEQKDKLYRVVVKDPKLPPEELAKHHKDLSATEARLYVNVYHALDGIELIIKKCMDGTYCIWDWTEDVDAQLRNAYYEADQDPVFGDWCDDRKEFDKAWKESWVIKTEIRIAKAFVKIIEKL